MPQYFCSLTNEKRPGRIPEIITDDQDAITTFIAQWDIPGRGVYACVSPLKEGATRRSLETVAAIVQPHVDIDFKDLEERPDEIDAKLLQLPLEPTWVRNSGGGRHVIYELHEPIEASDVEYFQRACVVLKRLTAALSGDPAPAHPAALLRVAGTHNSKRPGEPVSAETLWGSGKTIDLTDAEALIDLLPETGSFTRKPGGNGHDRSSTWTSGGGRPSMSNPGLSPCASAERAMPACTRPK